MTTNGRHVSQCSLVDDCSSHMRTAAKRAYTNQKTPSVDDDRITDMLPMVPRIVHRVVTYLRPPLSHEDLISAGTVGLVKAARDYDPSRQAEFKTYAYIRIRGAVLDELRRWSFVPPGVDKQIGQATKARIEITEQTGSTPTDEQLAQKLHISVDKLYSICESARAKHFISIDRPADETVPMGNLLPASGALTPHQHLERSELVERLTKAIQQLDQRQRQIILLYYKQQLTMKQIAEVFEITEPRVSQLHASALMNLSAQLGRQNDGER